MNEKAQTTLLLLLQSLLRNLRPDENFDIYRFSPGSVHIRLSSGTGQSKWNVERSVSVTELETMRDEWIGAMISSLFERLRLPVGRP